MCVGMKIKQALLFCHDIFVERLALRISAGVASHTEPVIGRNEPGAVGVKLYRPPCSAIVSAIAI